MGGWNQHSTEVVTLDTGLAIGYACAGQQTQLVRSWWGWLRIRLEVAGIVEEVEIRAWPKHQLGS